MVDADTGIARRPGRAGILLEAAIVFASLVLIPVLDLSTSKRVALLGGAIFLGLAVWVHCRQELLADARGVQIRNVRSRSVGWDEIAAIEPTHQGLRFELKAGGSVTAAATRPSGWIVRPPRYDQDLVDRLRTLHGTSSRAGS